MIQISHECPISILEKSRDFNDYDYALVHLFEEQPEYLEFFKESVKQGRNVLLDNSIFELGTAFEADRFAYWINELKPTQYIIPDVLEDFHGTRDSAINWMQKYSNVPGIKIGVVQGKDYEEICSCYRDLIDLGVDKIAISFNYSYYEQSFPHADKIVSWSFGRIKLINDMINDGIIDYEKPHHLLGAADPREFSFYRDDKYSFIESLDTSSPIVKAIDHGLYRDDVGLYCKPKVKLFELIEAELNPTQLNNLDINVNQFRRWVNG